MKQKKGLIKMMSGLASGMLILSFTIAPFGVAIAQEDARTSAAENTNSSVTVSGEEKVQEQDLVTFISPSTDERNDTKGEEVTLTQDVSSHRGNSTDNSSVPELRSPENGAFVDGNNFESDWDRVVGADTYVYELMKLNPTDDAARVDNNPLIFVEHRVNAPETSFTQTVLTENMYGWRVKAIRGGVEGDWSPRWKITIDNTAPRSEVSLTEGQSFEEMVPVAGTTVDNWNVDSVIISEARYANNQCGDFTRIDTVQINNAEETTAHWNYDWAPQADGTYCFKAEGVDFAGNQENGTVISNIRFAVGNPGPGNGGSFSSAADHKGGNNGDFSSAADSNTGGGDPGNGGSGGDNGGGNGGGGGHHGGGSSSGGYVLGTSTDEGLIEALKLLNEILETLRNHIIANMAAGVAPLPGVSGPVLGEYVEAQEIGDEVIAEEPVVEEEQPGADEVASTTEENEQTPETNQTGSRVWLWILFLVVIAVLLYLAFRKTPQNK